MSQTSSIEWTDATWNPVRGCTKISPGCKNCYAATFAERWRGTPGHPYERGFDLRLVPERVADPISWTKSRMIFVNSMSDLFHKGVGREYIRAVFAVMQMANWHIYQVLTKRAERMKALSNLSDLAFAASRHIWLGVSVEDRKYGLPRIDHLRETNAAIRFLSIEPLLEDIGRIDLTGIDWVIVGGESGPRARPMKPEWVRSIRDQCQDAGVRFFFKQWGGTNKKAAGRELDRRKYDQFPDVEFSPPPSAVERNKLKTAQREAEDSRQQLALPVLATG